MSHHILLIIHLISATIWVGGHLILAIGILPEVLKKKSPQLLLNFERKYEKIGMPALVLLVTTGVWMAYQLGQGMGRWFHFDNPIETVVSLKLILLFSTLAFALSANLFVLPNLSAKKLPIMAFHIICVTLLGVGMLILGSYVRYGGIIL